MFPEVGGFDLAVLSLALVRPLLHLLWIWHFRSLDWHMKMKVMWFQWKSAPIHSHSHSLLRIIWMIDSSHPYSMFLPSKVLLFWGSFHPVLHLAALTGGLCLDAIASDPRWASTCRGSTIPRRDCTDGFQGSKDGVQKKLQTPSCRFHHEYHLESRYHLYIFIPFRYNLNLC